LYSLVEITIHKSLGHSVFMCESQHNKTPQIGQLQQQTFTASSAGGWQSEVQKWAGLVSPKASLLDVQTPSLPCVLTWLSLHTLSVS